MRWKLKRPPKMITYFVSARSWLGRWVGMKGGAKKQCVSWGGKLMGKVHVVKIETDGRTARVILSDGNELHGLVYVDCCAAMDNLSKFTIEGYVLGVSESNKNSYN
jgi:hypothetical protein